MVIVEVPWWLDQRFEKVMTLKLTLVISMQARFKQLLLGVVVSFYLSSTLFIGSAVAQSDVQIPDESRTWRDKSGSYTVEAKLIKLTAENVELLKADGLAVTVPLAALSEADQTYLRQLPKMSSNPFAGGVASSSGGAASAITSDARGLEILEPGYAPETLASDGRPIFVETDEDPQPIGPAGVEIRPASTPFVKGMMKYDAYTRHSPPILLDGEQLTFATSAHRVGNAVSDETFGRVFVYRHGKRTDELVIDLPHTLRIYDHHIPSDVTLATVNLEAGAERGGDLVLLRGIAAGKPVALKRWHVPEWDKVGFKPKVEYAKLTGPSTAVVQVNNNVYVWDLNSGQCAFKIERVQAGSKIRVSANGRYLALPATQKCRLIDLQAGETVGTYPFPKLTPEVNFSPDGTKLALVAGTQADVWDLQSAQKAHELILSGNSGGFHGWVGNEYLLLKHVGLVDLDLGMAVWSYYLPSSIPVVVLNGGVITMDVNSKSAIYSLPIPHPQVAVAKRRLTSPQSRLLALKPGSQVSIQVTSTENIDLDAMREGLRKAAENAGWRVAERAPTSLVAHITRGEKQTLHFRYLLSSPLDPPEKVRIHPFTASVQIRQGSNVLWSRSSSNMVPSLIHLEKGEKLKQAVKQYEKADPEYFQRLMIPPQILTPEAASSVGRSRNDNGKWRDF